MERFCKIFCVFKMFQKNNIGEEKEKNTTTQFQSSQALKKSNPNPGASEKGCASGRTARVPDSQGVVPLVNLSRCPGTGFFSQHSAQGQRGRTQDRPCAGSL